MTGAQALVNCPQRPADLLLREVRALDPRAGIEAPSISLSRRRSV